MWWKKVVFIFALLVSGFLGVMTARTQIAALDVVDSVQRDYDTALSSVDLHGIKVHSDTDIVNILLVGNDFREEAPGYSVGGLTDTMMIATLDMRHKNLKLTTLMRDMLVEIPGYGNNKLNSAFSRGGIELLYQTLAQNFNIRLDGYVAVSFDAFRRVVDDVGGVEVELTESEASYLNRTNYIKPKKYRTVKAGKNKLNGAQALGYCRIRKTVYTPNGLTDDYGRTWRQRNTISKIFDNVKKLPKSKWMDIAKDVLGSDVTTDLRNKQIFNYIKDVVMMGTTEIYQLQIPINPYFTSGLVDGVGSCLSIQREHQAAAMKQFIFQYDGKKGEFQYDPYAEEIEITEPPSQQPVQSQSTLQTDQPLKSQSASPSKRPPKSQSAASEQPVKSPTASPMDDDSE